MSEVIIGNVTEVEETAIPHLGNGSSAKVLIGNAIDLAKELQAAGVKVQMVCTSPPY